MINRLPMDSDDDLLIMDEDDFYQTTKALALLYKDIKRSAAICPNFIDVGPLNFLLVRLHGGLCYQSLYKVNFRGAVGFVTIPVY